MYWRVHRTADSAFTAGLNFTGMTYDKNLRYFTYGHGGCFSPQQFLAMSVPFDWAQRSGRLSYQIKGALGVQYFRRTRRRTSHQPHAPERRPGRERCRAFSQ